MRLKKKITLLLSTLLVLMLCIVSVTQAAQQNPPLYESYGYTYPPQYPSTWSTVSGIQPLLSYSGYNSKAWINTSAYYVRRTMGDDAVFFIFGEGLPGFVAAWDLYNYTKLSANSTSDNSAYSLQYRFQGTTELNDLKLAVYMACRTALTDNTTADGTPAYGNLLNMSSSLGVDLSIGWQADIASPMIDDYAHQFFNIISYGGSVQFAHDSAVAALWAEWGWDGNADSELFVGSANPSNLVIYPAGYGS